MSVTYTGFQICFGSQKCKVAVLYHMLCPESSSHFSYLRPLPADFENSSSDQVILLGSPLLLADLGVQVVQPALPDLLRVAEVAPVRLEVQLLGDFVPFRFILVGSQ